MNSKDLHKSLKVIEKEFPLKHKDMAIRISSIYPDMVPYFWSRPCNNLLNIKNYDNYISNKKLSDARDNIEKCDMHIFNSLDDYYQYDPKKMTDLRIEINEKIADGDVFSSPYTGIFLYSKSTTVIRKAWLMYFFDKIIRVSKRMKNQSGRINGIINKAIQNFNKSEKDVIANNFDELKLSMEKAGDSAGLIREAVAKNL